jgi:hypothetical protein
MLVVGEAVFGEELVASAVPGVAVTEQHLQQHLQPAILEPQTQEVVVAEVAQTLPAQGGLAVAQAAQVSLF